MCPSSSRLSPCSPPITYLPNQPEEVLEALRSGKISSIDVATEALPDFFLLYAIESGLLASLSKSFPDPRTQQPEISTYILLAAGLVGHFAGLYALSQLPYALHSPKLLAALGMQVVVNEPGHGLSRKGTQSKGAAFHGDVARKMLKLIEKRDTTTPKATSEIDTSAPLPGQSLLDWYNREVGTQFCRAANVQPTLHILDCTDLPVTLSNTNYERSGVTSKGKDKGKGKPAERGYKLATLRSLLDDGALITAIAWGAIQEHDLPVTADLLRTTPHLHPGDTLLHDRGFLDAATITHLKKERQVDVCTGLKSDMLLLRAATAQANAHPGNWREHPTRKNQQVQRVTDLGSIWQGLGVPMNVCVVRFRKENRENKENEQEWDYVGFACTDLSLEARQIITLYQTRPEVEEQYRQLKGHAWNLSQFQATRLVQILWHVILTLIAYNLFQVYANSKAGRQFAGKTKQMIEREHTRNPTAHLLVCTPYAFAVFEIKEILYLMLDLPEDVRQTIRRLLQPKPG